MCTSLNQCTNTFLRATEKSTSKLLEVLMPRLLQLGSTFTTNFSKNMLSSLKERLSSNDSPAEILNYIQTLKSGLEQDQINADQEKATKFAEWDSQIQTLKDEIANLEEQVKKLDSLISNTSNLQREAEREHDVLVKAQEILNEKEKLLQAAREKDIADYQQRKTTQTALLASVKKVLSMIEGILATATATGSMAQVNDLIKDIKKIGKNDSMLALFTLSSRFDKNTVEKIVSLISKIKLSIEKSLLDDEEKEIEAVTNYNNLLKEIADKKIVIQSEIDVKAAEIKSFKELIIKYNQEREAALNSIKDKTKAIEDIEKLKSAYNQTYLQYRSLRLTDINSVNEAENLFKTNQSALKEIIGVLS